MLYLVVKFVHVVLAIVAVGSNLTYFLWFAQANAHPESAETILRGLKRIDDRVANPAYGLLLITGFLEAYLGGISMGAKWISIALGLYIVMVVIGAAMYSPTLKKQIAAVASGGVKSPEAVHLAARGRSLGMVLVLIVLAIVFVMVVKPT
jgi:uncharacterized membrane protein